MQPESITLKAADLLKFLIGLLRSFPREQRFQIGDRMQTIASEVLESSIEAFYTPAGEKKKEILARINIKLEQLRFYVRLCYEQGYYSSVKYGELANRIQEIGRMVGGWIKSMK